MMKNKGIIRAILICCCINFLLVLLFSGCSMRPYRANNFLDTEAIEGVSSVAVLPFHNLSEQVNAGVIVTNMLMAELVQHGKFRVVKYGDLRNFFLQRRMTSISSIDIKILRALRQEFKVDAVIMGTVLQYEDGGGSSNNKKPVPPSIAINSKVLDTRTGRILAKGEFMEKGSATGYLLSDRDRQLAFALARDFAQKLISKIGTHGA